MKENYSENYSEYIANNIDKEMSNFLLEYLIEESKNYLFYLHKEKNLSDILKMYNILKNDLISLNLVKLKVREFKINLLLK